MRSSRYFVCFFMTLVLSFVKAENIDSLMADTQVSLITCDPGSDLYSLFGHSAIRVHNAAKNYDIVYNYGTFDFRTPGFMVKFMQGKLLYKLSAYGFDSFLMEYNYDKRGVREQVLNISSEEKSKVIRFLEHNALPENAFYKYDFFYDNCSSRIRDVFEKTLEYQPTYTSKEKVTMRDLLHQYLTGSPWTGLGIDMIIGSRADIDATPGHQMFLPDKLHDILGAKNYKSKPLLHKDFNVLVFDEEREVRKRGTFFSPRLVNFMLVLLVLFFHFAKKQKWLKLLFKFWCIFSFTASLIILLLWFATDHQACALNWNILWLNPLYLLFFIEKFRYKKSLAIALATLLFIAFINGDAYILPQAMPGLYFTFGLMLLLWKIKNESIIQSAA
jgi:hypothetical protein